MKQQTKELSTMFGNQHSVQYAYNSNGRLENNPSEGSLSASQYLKNVKKGRNEGSQQSLGIQMGNNRICFQQLKQAMLAGKKGLKMDLTR